MTSDHILARERDALNLLVKPLSVASLSEELGCSMQTARRTVNRLRYNHLVEATGRLDERSRPTYILSNRQPMPRIYNGATGGKLSPVELLRAYALNPLAETDGVRASRALFSGIAELLHLSVVAESGANVSAELAELRVILQRAVSVLSNNIDMLQQILSTPQWWDTERLANLSADEEWSANEIERNYAAVRKATNDNA